MAQRVGCAPGSLPLSFSCRKLTRMDSVCWQRSLGIYPTGVHCQSQKEKGSLELRSSKGFFSCVWIAWTADRDCGATSRAVNLSLPLCSRRICILLQCSYKTTLFIKWLSCICVSPPFCQWYKLGVPSSKFRQTEPSAYIAAASCKQKRGRAEGAWPVPGRHTAGKKMLLTAHAVLLSRSLRIFQIRETPKMQNGDVNPNRARSFFFCLFLILTLNTFPVQV